MHIFIRTHTIDWFFIQRTEVVTRNNSYFFKTRKNLQQLREYLKSKSNMFSSEHIQNEVLTITSEHPYSEDHFYSKSQENISPYNQSFEQPEEELAPLTIRPWQQSQWNQNHDWLTSLWNKIHKWTHCRYACKIS